MVAACQNFYQSVFLGGSSGISKSTLSFFFYIGSYKIINTSIRAPQQWQQQPTSKPGVQWSNPKLTAALLQPRKRNNKDGKDGKHSYDDDDDNDDDDNDDDNDNDNDDNDDDDDDNDDDDDDDDDDDGKRRSKKSKKSKSEVRNCIIQAVCFRKWMGREWGSELAVSCECSELRVK